MKGEIQRLIAKKGKSGAPYWPLGIEGTLFSTADPSHVAYIKEGDTVQVQWKKVGGYNNITAIRKIENPQDTRARHIERGALRVS